MCTDLLYQRTDWLHLHADVGASPHADKTSPHTDKASLHADEASLANG